MLVQNRNRPSAPLGGCQVVMNEPDLPEFLGRRLAVLTTPPASTPRERFRRFLLEQVTGVAAIRSMLDQAHATLGDQHARARQDLILLLGRFLGFDVAFGSYEATAGSVRLEGHWRSRRRARIAIEVRSEQTADADVDTLARTVNALTASLPGDSANAGSASASRLRSTRRFDGSRRSSPSGRSTTSAASRSNRCSGSPNVRCPPGRS